jgi:hypothetical protein
MDIVLDCNTAVVEIGIKCLALLNITFCVMLFPSLWRSWMPRDGQLIFYCALLPWIHTIVQCTVVKVISLSFISSGYAISSSGCRQKETNSWNQLPDFLLEVLNS